MTEVIVVGEGPTEETFVRKVLAPALETRTIYVQSRLIRTSNAGRGGALTWDRVRLFLRNLLRERHDTYVTTLFDLYGLDSGFPGRTEAARLTDPVDRVRRIEERFVARVVEEAGCRADRFLPHIQPHEFEALLFADIAQLAHHRREWQKHVAALQVARDAVRSPEHINDGIDTHPSARLQRLLKPRYEKVLDGVELAQRIGLDKIRRECAHFAGWLGRIESLPSLEHRQTRPSAASRRGRPVWRRRARGAFFHQTQPCRVPVERRPLWPAGRRRKIEAGERAP